MKVILIQDVDNFGSKGEVKNVADGDARNYLLPKKLAVQATPQKLKELNKQIEAFKQKEAQEEKTAQDMAEKLENKEFVITAPAGKEGKLFGSVTSAHIAEKLAENGFQVDKKKVDVKNPLKTVGEHMVPLKLWTGITASIKVVVAAEGASKDQADQTAEPETDQAQEEAAAAETAEAATEEATEAPEASEQEEANPAE